MRWCGDLTEIPTDEGKLQLARAALCVGVAMRGGAVAEVLFHTNQGGEYTGNLFVTACAAPASPSPCDAPARPWTTRSRNRSTPP
ncbi:hypothetical protein C8E89_14529 [Mycolicibacterium moriokaense]|uniref:Uncharacterized protein n=1 Tax=Mycolicibacterium moriokaense TaxID=39691 RepID=A0A318H3V6_9MYCO|nr:hypothetical protein C8E89_14529 [Mycolicibacterium moriokaense]